MIETVSNHVHTCPKCRLKYGAYNPNCGEPEVWMCGRCVMLSFAAKRGGRRNANGEDGQICVPAPYPL
jgi:hypothetical protein